jgi:hypothetical protein
MTARPYLRHARNGYSVFGDDLHAAHGRDRATEDGDDLDRGH